MLSFFRINDPFRLIGVVILLVLTRIAFLTNTDLLMIPEIKWMLLGEKLSQGNMLYKQVWDFTAPLSSLCYALIDILFGRSVLAYRILSILIIFFYSFFYSKILINNNLYLEKTYIPSVVFAVLCSISVDFYTLSPPLLGLGFIFMSLNYLFRLLEKGLQDNQYYNLGFLIGLAALFYLPYAVFLILCIVGMFFYSSTSLRKYLLTILGFCFPYLIVVIIYSLYYGLDSLYYMYLISFLTLEKSIYIPIQDQIILIVIPVLFVVMAMGKLVIAPRFINYQQKVQQLMLLYLIAAVFSYIFIIEVTPYHLIVALPGLTFFISHYFLLIRRKIFSEIAFILFIIAIPLLSLGAFYKIFDDKLIHFNELIASKSSEVDDIVNKKVLVLGEDISVYKNNSLAGPYLNWQLAKNHFKNLKFYEVVLEVNNNLNREIPEVIIDETNSAKSLFDQIPSISRKYQKCGRNIYCLKK